MFTSLAAVCRNHSPVPPHHCTSYKYALLPSHHPTGYVIPSNYSNSYVIVSHYSTSYVILSHYAIMSFGCVIPSAIEFAKFRIHKRTYVHVYPVCCRVRQFERPSTRWYAREAESSCWAMDDDDINAGSYRQRLQLIIGLTYWEVRPNRDLSKARNGNQAATTTAWPSPTQSSRRCNHCVTFTYTIINSNIRRHGR